MIFENHIIHITQTVEVDDNMYSLLCLRASALSLSLNGVRCYLDGTYLLCLTFEDRLVIHGGEYAATNLQFLPYFYNVNLNHDIIGMPIYEEMKTRYGYPDFHWFRERDERFIGILPINENEYETTKLSMQRSQLFIDDHPNDEMWSCHVRMEIISILRIAECVYYGEQIGVENKILRYIKDNIGEPLTLQAICNRFHTNRTTLSRIVKELTGMSPGQYILEERMNQSRPDLLFTSIPIREIAERYGFDDVNYYIRSFKKRFGKTPMQYRAEGREERIRNQSYYRKKAKEALNQKEAKQNDKKE